MITRTIKTETESLGSICTSSSVNVFNQRFVSLPTFSRCCFFFLPCHFMFESILSWILGFFLLKSKNVIPDGISEQGSRIFLFLELQCCVEFHFLNVKGYLYQKAASSWIQAFHIFWMICRHTCECYQIFKWLCKERCAHYVHACLSSVYQDYYAI